MKRYNIDSAVPVLAAAMIVLVLCFAFDLSYETEHAAPAALDECMHKMSEFL